MAAEAVLEFVDATLEAPGFEADRLESLSLALGPGAAIFVHEEETVRDHLPLADAACGLLAPSAGRVLFAGADWAAMPVDEQLRRRARIGRVFAFHGWVHNLDVLENVMLSERIHTDRPDEDIRMEAEALARRFGLPGIPEGRPSWVRRSELRRAEWVRALVGSPGLVLLERPERDVAAAAIPLLLEAVAAACGRGAAAIWITRDPALGRACRATGGVRHAVVRDGRIEINGGVG